MAKVNVSKVKSAAASGGVRVPPSPVRIQKPDQIKKQAQAQAKARMKMLIRVAIMAGILLVIGLVVYFVKFYGRMPKDAFKTAVNYAYKDDVIPFRDSFTNQTIELVEAGGNGETQWLHLMDGITPAERPKVVNEKITEKNGIKTAELTVKVGGEDRTVYMLQEDGDWKINLNVTINPRKVTLPEDVPPEYVDNFDVSEEPDAWWEEGTKDKDDEEGDKGKQGGFLSSLKKKKLF